MGCLVVFRRSRRSQKQEARDFGIAFWGYYAIIMKRQADRMEDFGLAAMLIDTYFNLQRIKESSDPQEEVDYQLRLVIAKLEAMGVVFSEFEKKVREKK